VKGPTAAELLVKEVRAHEADRFRFQELAYKCKDIQELREELKKMLEVKQE